RPGWIGRIRAVNSGPAAADHVGRRSLPLLRSRSRRLVAAAIVTVLVVAAGVVGSAVRAPVAGAVTFPLIKVGEADSTYNSYNPGTSVTVAFSSPAVGDVTGDGVPEIVTGGMDGCTRVIAL